MDFFAFPFPKIFALPPIINMLIGFSISVMALVKGNRSRDNVLFSLVCSCYTIISIPFLSHHLIGNYHYIMMTERGTHLVYVFLPAISILLYHQLLGIKRKWLERFILIITIPIAFTTLTPYYIEGLYKYNWGYIAKGGIFFKFFGIMGFIVLVYGIFNSIKKLSTEKNSVTRKKIEYIILSLNIVGILTALNIPAMIGINFYPLGNFMFIPMIVMAYGLLRYRLLDIKSIMHVTLIYFVTSSIVIIPDIIAYNLLKDFFVKPDVSHFLFFLLLMGFLLFNIFHFQLIQPYINKLFNKKKYNLLNIESTFTAELSRLKNLPDFINEFIHILKTNLYFKEIRIFLQQDDTLTYFNYLSDSSILLNKPVSDELIKENSLIEKSLIETDPHYKKIRAQLATILDRENGEYLLPLLQNNRLVGFVILSERANLKHLNPSEIYFLNNIRTTVTIAISNATLFENVSNLKNNLEILVDERSQQLKEKSDQIQFELHIAHNVQMSLLPPAVTLPSGLVIAARLDPLVSVSGDCYDYIVLNQNRVALMLADVSGHGVPSALFTAMIRSELRSIIRDYPDKDTDFFASTLNNQLSPLLQDAGYYFTMFLAIIDIEKQEISYTNCGHNEGLLIHKNNEVTKLNSDGYFIGAVDTYNYETKKYPFSRNERLVVFTDGLTESRNANDEFYGDDRLISILKNNNNLDPAAQIEGVWLDVADFQKDPKLAKDDRTMMIIGWQE